MRHWKIFTAIALVCSVAYAATVPRTITADYIKTVAGQVVTWSIPHTQQDTFAGVDSPQTFTHKTIDGNTNTLLNVPASAISGFNSVPNGGTGNSSLAANGVLVGEGTSPFNAVTGSQFQSLIANASGDPSFQALNLAQSAATQGILPVSKGGTGITSVPVAGSMTYSNGSAYASMGLGAAGTFPISDGAGNVTWSNNPMTHTIFSATGASVGGYWFDTSAISASGLLAGCVYTNNGVSFTILQTVLSGATRIWASSTQAPTASGTLTYSSGGGASGAGCNGATGTAITFFDANQLAIYNPPANTKVLKIFLIGGGGGGSGAAAVSAGVSTSLGAGGGGGSTCIKYISNPVGPYYYSISTGGAGGVGNAQGATARPSSFVSSSVGGPTFMMAAGGDHGGTTGAVTTFVQIAVGAGGFTIASIGCDYDVKGGNGGTGIIYSLTQQCGGQGGSSMFAGPVGTACGNGGGSANGVAGNAPGGGGLGAGNFNSASSFNGGAGAAGGLLIEEFQ